MCAWATGAGRQSLIMLRENEGVVSLYACAYNSVVHGVVLTGSIYTFLFYPRLQHAKSEHFYNLANCSNVSNCPESDYGREQVYLIFDQDSLLKEFLVNLLFLYAKLTQKKLCYP